MQQTSSHLRGLTMTFVMGTFVCVVVTTLPAFALEITEQKLSGVSLMIGKR